MSEYRWPIDKLNDILQPMRETDLVVIGSGSFSREITDTEHGLQVRKEWNQDRIHIF
ncbi:hypothetical protein [Mesotoga sp.]|uniref:hypothetical protein n=1 Tax=Mesotoga sp. TaxID=2053577 RepID=UPI00345F0023